jgi:hypothetical protein
MADSTVLCLARIALSRDGAPAPYDVAVGQHRSPVATDRQWQTRREAGTQSHGPHAGSRVAEQEVGRGGPDLPACADTGARGHQSRPHGRRAARSDGELPGLREAAVEPSARRPHISLRRWHVLVAPEQVRRVVAALDRGEAIPGRTGIGRPNTRFTLVPDEVHILALVVLAQGVDEASDP